MKSTLTVVLSQIALSSFKDVAMRAYQIETLKRYITTNKGIWLSAKIYSDQKNKNCEQCGGSFKSSEILQGYRIPTCETCKSHPKKFRIIADVVDSFGKKKSLSLRYDKQGNRLTAPFKCLFLLETIVDEQKRGVFNILDYDTAAAKEKRLFKNYAKLYLEFHRTRKLTPYGFYNKEKYVRRLMKYFENISIEAIDYNLINQYKFSFTDKQRTRDLCLGELRTMLKHAKDIGLITSVPKFDSIPKANKRTDIPELDDVLMVIDSIKDCKMKTALLCLVAYGIRPCELRSIKWEDIDLTKKRIHIRSHISKGVDIEGRKSVGHKKEKNLNRPLLPILEEYLNEQPRPINGKVYIFPGTRNKFMSEKVLNRAFKKALDGFRKEHHQLYSLRHARITEVGLQVKKEEDHIRFSEHVTKEAHSGYVHKVSQNQAEELDYLFDPYKHFKLHK